MSKFTDFLTNTKSDVVAFNASHGKTTAVIIALVVGAIVGHWVL